MRPVLPGLHAFGKLVANSHTVSVRADILRNGVPVSTGLEVIDGTISEQADAAIRSSLSCTIATPGRHPGGVDDSLAPAGSEIRIWRGIETADGTAELVVLGTFPIQSSDTGGLGDETQVEAVDRSQMVIDDTFLDVHEIFAGELTTDVIRTLVAESIPGVEQIVPETSDVTPQMIHSPGADRWQVVRELAASIGHEAWFDGLGRFRLTPVASTADTPALTIAEGEGGTLIDLGINLSRQGYSSVTVRGTNLAGSPVAATATDDDPNSGTYHGNPATRRNMPPIETDAVSSNLQALVQAEAELLKHRGITRSVQWSAIPDPRLETGDVVWFRRGVLGLSERHIIESLSIPLGPEGQMSGTTRTRQS